MRPGRRDDRPCAIRDYSILVCLDNFLGVDPIERHGLSTGLGRRRRIMGRFSIGSVNRYVVHQALPVRLKVTTACKRPALMGVALMRRSRRVGEVQKIRYAEVRRRREEALVITRRARPGLGGSCFALTRFLDRRHQKPRPPNGLCASLFCPVPASLFLFRHEHHLSSSHLTTSNGYTAYDEVVP